jgi:ABC-2 type transport system permease protein
MFSSGIPTGLPIAVVDQDHSSGSRELIRRLGSMRGLAVTAQPPSLEAAQPMVRSGTVYGIVHIPAGWDRDRLRNVSPPVVLYDNAQFSLVAGTIGGDVRAAVTSMAIERLEASEARFGGGFAQAAMRLNGVQADLRTLFNPSLSYEAYFAGMLLPVALHLLCVIAAVSAVGREFRDRSVDAWMASAGGSLPRALAGKLAPAGLVYVLLSLGLVVTFAGWRGWAPAGSPLLWMVAIAVLMLVSVSVAIMLVGLTLNLRRALSLTGVYVATGLAFSGFSYPRAAMGTVAQWWSGLLPYTHYLPVQQGQWLGGASASAWAQGMVPLLLFIVVPLLIGLPLLSRAVAQPARWGAR